MKIGSGFFKFILCQIHSQDYLWFMQPVNAATMGMTFSLAQ